MDRKSWERVEMAADHEVCERFQPSAHSAKAWWEDDDSATTAAANRQLRVLIVDDNVDLAYLMSVLVQKCGHEVQIAYDGSTALQMAATFHPDVLFVDIALPRMDGFCVARELCREREVSGPLLIAVTGYADEAHHALGMKAGFDHYVIKPVAFRTLAELMLLARRRLVRSVAARVTIDEASEPMHAGANY